MDELSQSYDNEEISLTLVLRDLTFVVCVRIICPVPRPILEIVDDVEVEVIQNVVVIRVKLENSRSIH